MKTTWIIVLSLVMALPSTILSQSKGQAGYNLSCDQVDISAFVKLVGEVTGRKFVVSDDVTGKVTIVTPHVKKEEVFPFFVSVLESCGASVIQEGEIYRVINLPEKKTRIGEVVGVNDKTPAEGFLTKVIHLSHVSASQVKKILESGVSGGKEGAIGALEETNHIIVTDTAENIKRIEKIVQEVDKEGLSRSTEVIFLKFANARDLAEQMNAAMYEGMSRGQRLQSRLPSGATTSSRLGTSSKSGFSRRAVVVASPHSNSLMLVGIPSQLADLKKIIKKMDVDAPSGRGNLNAIFLKYIQAADAAKNITALLTQLDKKTPYNEKRKVAVAASVENNALIVDAMPGDFEVVKKLVEQLDKVPEQVHISVLIAEMNVGEGVDIGVDMAAVDMPDEVGSTVVSGSSKVSEGVDKLMGLVQQGMFPGGLTVGVAYGNRVDAEGNIVSSYPGLVNINAIKKNSNFDIVSETALEAQNNKEASINIVNEIPITKSTIEGAGDSRDVIQNIDRLEVGTKLKITPHIIPGGEVQMSLKPSIEFVVDPGPSGTQFAPTIARREVETTVTVPDRQTIVIAGLTRSDNTEVVRKVPILGSIPLLGFLFRHTITDEKKTNLLIFVTPTIVSNVATSDRIMKDWKQKAGLDKLEKEE